MEVINRDQGFSGIAFIDLRNLMPVSLFAAVIGSFVFVLPLVADQPVGSMQQGENHQQSIKAWRASRHDRLTQPDGWLTLVGLEWLNEGENRVGSAAAVLAGLPASRQGEVYDAIAFAVERFGLPKSLKLSVHSGSDKFSIYGPMEATSMSGIFSISRPHSRPAWIALSSAFSPNRRS